MTYMHQRFASVVLAAFSLLPLAAKVQAQSVLANTAAALQPGQWAELPTINMDDVLANTGGASGSTLSFSDAAVWDPTTHTLFFIGGDHDPASGCPRFVSYSESTNTWQLLPNATWFQCGTVSRMHGLNHNAIDVANGKLYHRPFGDMIVRKYDIATQTWSNLPTLTTAVMGYNQCCVAIAWFPERNALQYASIESGTNGALVEYSETTGQWARVAGNLPMGQYQNFGKYDPVNKVFLFGGGAGDRHVYKLDASGVVTPLSDAPIYVGVQDSVVTSDPVSGQYLFLDNSNEFYSFDVNADTWTLLAPTPLFAPPVYDPPLNAIVVTPIPEYGVNMYARCYVDECRAYLYKHVLTAPDTTPPTVTGVSATNITASHATITWSTNEPANARVDYGASTPYTQSTPVSSTLVTAHSVEIFSLTPNITYHFQAVSIDGAGNAGSSDDLTFTTLAPDTTPPVISGVGTTTVTSSAATIVWTTDEIADGRVDYGATPTYGQSTTLDTALVTAHVATVTGLTAGGTYHYRVVSTDAEGNEATSGDFTVTASQGPAAAYAFDEGTGLATADSSGNGVSGTLVNGTTWTDGKNGNAVSFDGTNDKVTLPSSFDVTRPYSVEAWIRPTSYANWRAIFSKRADYALNQMRFDIGLSMITGRVYLANGNATVMATYAPPLNAWTHLAVVSDTTSTRIFVNGALQETLAAFATGTSSTAPVAIGSAANDDDRFAGAIDDLRIYNRALSQPEVLADMNTPAGSAVLSINQPAAGAAIVGSTVDVAYTAIGNAAEVDHARFTLDTGAPVDDATFDGSYQITDVASGAHVLSGYLVRSDGSKILGSDAVVAFSTAPPDVTPPTAPAGLVATQAGATQIDLSWSASTDDVGVTLYMIEGCVTASCAFASVASTASTSYTVTGLTANTGYSYRVFASDAASNASSYSNTASATTAAVLPTTPTLSAVASGTQIDLSWTASTSSLGIADYVLERCVGAACTTFAQIATPTGTSYPDLGLAAGTTYSYRVLARDTAGNSSPYSNRATASTPAAPDTQPPTAPTGLNATAASSTQIALTWTASSDNVGVTGYIVERCQGAGCSGFAQIATPAVAAFNDSGLTASTTYNYRVRARDAANNESGDSNGATATTQAPAAIPLAFVQSNYATPQTPQTTVSVPFIAAQTAGNLNAVIIGWYNTTSSVVSVTDTRGHTYVRAVGPTTQAAAGTQSIYYAANIIASAAGTNTVTVTFNAAVPYPDLRIAEYAGVDPLNPVDVVAAGTGSGTSSNSGAVTTTNANDLLVAGNYVTSSTTAAGAGFTRRAITVPDGSILEDRIVTAAGSYSATASMSSGSYIMQMVAFRGGTSGGGGGDTQAPSVPAGLIATAASSTQIDLSWTASTDNVAVTGYIVERCQGAGCSTFAQIATPTGTTLNDTGLTASTSYSYRVRARDAASNQSGNSSTATASTQAPPDTQAPTAPTGLSATPISGTQINLSWTASTDNVAVTGYIVERCEGAGCSSFAQIATPTGTTLNDTGLTSSTSYSYRVRARDAANNQSGNSGTATASTLDTQAPTTPAGLGATPISGTQIDLSWTASTDNVAVTGYIVERCEGAGCSSFAQIATPAGTTLNDTGLTSSTSYSYRVRARDAASNQSGNSSTATASTLDTQAPTVPAGLTATMASSAQINLSWTASTDDVGVTGYIVERCEGAGCSSFAQIATPTGTAFNDTGLTAGTSYSYRVRARDAANNQSGNSNTASATTDTVPDTQAPSAPAGLTATTASSTQIDLSWAASTDDVGVTGYLVERCSGAGCSSFAQIATPAGTTFSDTSLGASTAYSYRVRARDAANNQSGYSGTASATTQAPPDTEAPTVPTGLTATTASSTQINLAWTASTDDVGVTGYIVERCAGAGCSGFAQIATPAGTAFNDTGLAGSTSYSYRVRARDAANNQSANSSSATAATDPTPDTQAPTAPAGLTATAISSTQVNLSWTASTDDVAVTGYIVERCQGAGCSSFAQIGTPTGTTLSDTGLTASTSYSYRVRARDAANNQSGNSNIATTSTQAPPDTQAPTAPAGLSATAATSTQINLSWTAATDDVAVTGYLLERCQGPGCSTFAQIAAPTDTTYNDSGLTPSTSYSYRVRARDAANNQGPFSSTATASTQAASSAPLAFIQSTYVTPQTPQTTVSATYPLAQVAGDLNVVVIGWYNTTSSILSVTDSRGHTYFPAVGPTTQAAAGTQAIYYAANIIASAAGTNTVTITFNGAVPYPDLRIAEYSGVDPLNPVDVVAAGTGTGTTSTAGPVTTTNANDLIVAGNYVTSSTNSAGSGFTLRHVTSPDGSILEDRIVTTAGSYSATASMNAGSYIMQMVAFRGGSGSGGDVQAPSVPSGVTATAASSTQINLSWTASTDNVAVTGYIVERCQGAGCSTFAQVATPATPGFNDTGLTAATSYSYRVRARDAANNQSGNSATATATTQAAPDTQAPTVPAGLSATAVSTTQIDLSWAASTDNVAVTGYIVERCQGAGCSSFAQIATPTGTTLSDAGLAPATSYSYRVRARDAANNQSGNSITATATTPAAGDTTPPSVPASLTATVVSATQINLSWTASTDDVGVTGYFLERCQGAGCSNFAQIGTPTGTAHNDTGLTPSTSYSYRIRARDAANNQSGNSATATATTQSQSDTTPPTVPGSLTATVASSTQINLSWIASTDNVGVFGYIVERCEGAGCSIFAQIATPTGTTFNDTGLNPSTSYAYRVRARDVANNQSGNSNTASATTQASGAVPLSFVQATYATPQTPQTTVSVTYAAAQLAGDLNVVIIGWYNTTSSVLSVTDTRGHTYVRAVGPTTQAAAGTQSIYYAANIVASPSGTNTVTVTFNGAVPYPDMRIAEYRGVDGLNPVDVVVAGTGTGTSANSGTVTTTNATDLLVAGSYVTSSTTAAGAGFTLRFITNPDGSILEDRFTTAAGNYAATASMTNGSYIMQMVAFRGGGGGVGDTDPPTAPSALTASAASATQINLSWTASTDNLAVTGYIVERCQSAGCSSFVQIATPTGTTLSDTGLTPLTSYSYRVRARDAANNQSGNSNIATAISQAVADTTPPTITLTAPANGATLGGNVTFSATASDVGTGVGGVQFRVDGVNVGLVVSDAPYTLSFNTAQFGNGAHTVNAYVWDGGHNVVQSSTVNVTFNNASPGDPATTGLWSPLQSWPLVAVHMSQLTDGRKLVWDRMATGNANPHVYDPVTGAVSAVPIGDGADLFCAGQATLPDGRTMSIGGHIGDHVGAPWGRIFNPATNLWSSTPDMTYGRWYPTTTTLPDGRILTLTGEVNCKNCYAAVPEIYNPVTNTWLVVPDASFAWPYYPHAYVLPNGRVAVVATAEAAVVTRVLDLTTNTWTPVDPTHVYDAYSSAMYLPGKILKTGTSTDTSNSVPTAATAYVIDMTAASPAWRQVPSMAFPRAYHLQTILPDGTVLVTGGGRTTGAIDIANAVYPAELWSPTAETFTTLASMTAPRIYHAVAELLPDGRVIVAGGGRTPGPDARDQPNAEIFAPPYLFKGARPTITSAPTQLNWNQSFTVQTPNAASIAKVTLVAIGNTTHGLNMSQRYLPLTFTTGAGSLNVTAPANANLAPPGYYMLFVIDTNGVPSVASMVRF